MQIRRHPLRFHEDDRGVRYCDVFPIPQGDINVVVIYPGAMSAWHRHQQQDDYQLCIKGALKFGLCDKPASQGGTVEWVYSSERSAKDGALFVPRGMWHGHYNFTDKPAIVLYWITNKYNPKDEERMSIEAMGFDWMRPAK
ncbi:MAG: cupin domain-containing protein [Candidatus Omnitrophica bacterium]|nr:cupin domain-containing protein [Candidatus Omnitrophota bacterium]